MSEDGKKIKTGAMRNIRIQTSQGEELRESHEEAKVPPPIDQGVLMTLAELSGEKEIPRGETSTLLNFEVPKSENERLRELVQAFFPQTTFETRLVRSKEERVRKISEVDGARESRE